MAQQQPDIILDLRKTSVEQAIGVADTAWEHARFVRIEVSGVVNPKRTSTTLLVQFLADGKSPVNLGSFSLFPSDNPGKFIIATRGLVRPGGAIKLTLVRPRGLTEKDTLQLTIRKMAPVTE